MGYLLVFVGAGIGGVLRYALGLAALRAFGPAFPVGTLAVNLVGCFLIGLLARLLPVPESGLDQSRLLLTTGILGGFTTFSAFALDVAGLWLREATGLALLYVGASVAGALAAVALGLLAGRMVAG